MFVVVKINIYAFAHGGRVQSIHGPFATRAEADEQVQKAENDGGNDFSYEFRVHEIKTPEY